MTFNARPERLLHFDGFRGVAALCVALFHFPTVSVFDGLPIVENGWLFVDLFFVLSGYILDRVYFSRGAEFAPYVLTRISRMMPLYYIIFALSFPLDAFRALGSADALRELSIATVVNGAALQSFGLLDRLWFYGPSWSISAEIWVNALIFPLVMNRYWHWWLGAIVLVLGYGYASRWDIQASWDFGAVRCIYGVCLGILVSRFLLRFSYRSKSWLAAVATDVAVLGLLGFGFPATRYHGLMPIGFAVVVTMLGIAEGSTVRKVLASKVPVFLGRVSFALYMTHYLIGGRVFRVAGLLLERAGLGWTTRTGDTEWQGLKLGSSEVTAVLWIVLYVVVCLGVAHLVNRLIEEPVYARLRVRWVRS